MAKLKATPKNFVEAQQVLGTQSSVRLGNNTYLERVQESDSFNLMIVVRLHNTAIVQFHSDGRVTLHTYNANERRTYRTVTTKERINQFIKGRVFQKAHQWYYTTGEHISTRPLPIEFTEGMEAA